MRVERTATLWEFYSHCGQQSSLRAMKLVKEFPENATEVSFENSWPQGKRENESHLLWKGNKESFHVNWTTKAHLLYPF